MKSKMHLRVVVVSPKDVQEERSSLMQIFEDLNRSVASEKGFHLDLFSWDMDAYPRFHALGPQGAIDESLHIQDCDIVIGLFWARFGTPVSDAKGGTEHELRIAYDAWKESNRPHIMVYFKNEPFSPKTWEEADQLTQVFEFRKTFSPGALYGEFRDVDDFKRRVSNDLSQLLRELTPGHLRFDKAVEQPPTPWRNLENAPTIDWANMRLKEVPLYTLSGLRAEPRNDDIVQDFRVDRQSYGNPNPVSYLWADAYKGNSITASIEEADPPHLAVTFENKPASWACNIAVRPIAERAVTTRGRTILAFETRLSGESYSGAGILPEIWISVRVANGWCQHWAYGPAGSYTRFPVTDAWKTVEVRFKSDNWWLFAVGDTNAFGPHKPDFSLVSNVVIVFGGPGTYEPGPGRGTVLIRNVHLRER